ncbi:hypothetical protein D9M72_342230 [compost metagenome]
MFHHHHRVGAARQHAAGGDRRGVAGCHFAPRHDAGRQRLAHEGQRADLFFHRAPGVGGLHGKAVDVGAVEAGHVDGGDRVVGEHPAQRRVQGNGLAAQRREAQVFAEAALGLVPRDDIEKLRLGFHRHSYR